MTLRSSPRFRYKCVLLYAATLICSIKLLLSALFFHLPEESQFLLRSVVNEAASGSAADKRRLIVLPNSKTLDLAQINFIFPSVEERVKYYMGSWYNRTANASEEIALCSAGPFYEKGMQPWSDRPYIFEEDTVSLIPNEAYAQDALKYYFSNAERGSRFLMSLGDDCHPEFDFIPGLIVKSRRASQNHFIGEPTTGPIMAYLSTERNYVRPFEEIKRLKESIPSWENKTDVLIWRGVSTGGGRRAKALSDIYKLNRSDIDVGFTQLVQQDDEGSIPREELHKYPIKSSMNIAEMLQYKYLLSIEGNDVATNIKWLLYSNSVVFQPLPTRVAWCMEDKLIPFYHYIPVKSDFSDLGVMLDWARKNDDLVQEIIRHSTEYMENLLVSEEAKAANDEIIRRMVRLYSDQFGRILAKCEGGPPKAQFLLPSVVDKESSGSAEKTRLIIFPNSKALDLAQINFTFPSVEERVKYYMGSWYNKTASASEESGLCSAAVPYYREGMQPWSDRPYIFDEHSVSLIPSQVYSQDALNYYFSIAERGSRFIMSFGDGCGHNTYEFIPGLIVKSRMASQNHFMGEPAIGPIMGYLEAGRHFISPIEEIKSLQDSIPSWENKMDALIWRGASTGGGRRAKALSNIYKLNRTDIDVGFTRLVQQEAEGRIPPEDLHKYPIKNSMNIAEMLQYKYLLSIEGNDVATNLKWLLYSNSVVFQPLPTRVTWCMEDKLIPFYHYIPLKSDFSDLGVMLDWARKNDDMVQEIIQHSTDYIENLIASDEAKVANDEIIRRMVRLYSDQFGHILAKCEGGPPKAQFLLPSVVNKAASGSADKTRLIILPNNKTLDLALMKFTFPRVEERVKYYMGSWYNRTANASEESALCSAVPSYKEGMQSWSDKPYIFDEHAATHIPNPVYSQDALRYYFSNAERGSRFVMSLGDAYQRLNYDSIPGLIVKSRMATQNHFIGEATTGPIIGYLKTERQYTGPIEEMKWLKDSNPSWENKIDALIWRGGSTGGSKRAQALSVIYKLNRSDIDVGFTSIILQQDAEGSIPPEELHKFPIKKSMNIAEMLQYKYLLSIEGNDDGTNLMCLLYFNSVVFKPLPTRVTWFMEDKLIPFYHYIPVKSDFSDLGVMLDWARENHDLVQEIIQHSTEYVENLLVSEEAKAANDEIIRRMVGLYSAQFGQILAKCES